METIGKMYKKYYNKFFYYKLGIEKMMFLFLLSLLVFNFCDASVCRSFDTNYRAAIEKKLKIEGIPNKKNNAIIIKEIIAKYEKGKINSSEIDLVIEQRCLEQQKNDSNKKNALIEENEDDFDCCSLSMLMSFLCMISFC